MFLKLKNSQIYEYALSIKDFYNNCSEIYLPAKCSFYLYKNLNILIEAAADIDRTRQFIIEKFGEEDEETEGTYKIPLDKQELVQEELKDLSEIVQELNIHMIPLKDFKDTELPIKYIKSLSFMIEDNEEEEEYGG